LTCPVSCSTTATYNYRHYRKNLRNRLEASQFLTLLCLVSPVLTAATSKGLIIMNNTQRQPIEHQRGPTEHQDREQPLRYAWEDVCKMRAMHAAGHSVAEIAEVFAPINKHYLRQVLHGESRPTADSHTRHRAPFVAPKNYPEEFLKSPDGQLWKRRGRGPARRRPVIPFTTIVQVRHEREIKGTPVSQLCIRFGISPSYLKEILAGRKRVSA
jgi:hypothetical protein